MGWKGVLRAQRVMGLGRFMMRLADLATVMADENSVGETSILQYGWKSFDFPKSPIYL